MMIIFKNIFYSDLKYFFKKIILNIDILKRLKNNIKNLFKIVFLPKKNKQVRVVIFDSVQFLSKKITKLNFFLKKPKPGQTDRFRLGF